MRSLELVFLHRLFCAWVNFVTNQARYVVFVIALASIFCGYYAFTNMSINSGTANMLSPELEFRQHSATITKAFPQFSKNLVVVVDAPTFDATQDAANLLLTRLERNVELFGPVFDPAAQPFFQKNGFLYMDSTELETLVEQLSVAQPFIGRLNASPDLTEFFRLMTQYLDTRPASKNLMSDDISADLFGKIADVMEGQVTGKTERLSWRSLITGKDDSATENRRIILLQPKTNYSSLSPSAEAIKEIRRLTGILKLDEKFDARVRITGSLALAEEELKSVLDGLGLAGIISMVLVVGLLYWALNSLWLLLATVISLICGLTLTAGFAALAVGTLNLISVAFAVLFIGLSVDFGIHYCLRYQERKQTGLKSTEALIQSARYNGGALSLTAIAAAIGFYSFLPTDYRGLAELGLIAGSGMFIALFINLTLLPALIVLLPKSANPHPGQRIRSGNLLEKLARHKRVIVAAFIIVIGICIPMLNKASFDFDPLNLKNPHTESVITLHSLMSDTRYSPYKISVLAKDWEQANILGKRIEALPTVLNVSTPSSFLPREQDKKLEIIERLSILIWPSLTVDAHPQSPSAESVRQSFVDFQTKLRTTNSFVTDGLLKDEIKRLNRAMSIFEKRTNLSSLALNDLKDALVGSLPARLAELKLSLEAETVEVHDIPAAVKDRFISSDGRARIDVFPSEKMLSPAALKRFVMDVRKLVPNATGAPVTIFEASNTVIRAFMEAGVTSFILIVGLVLIFTRRLRDIFLITVPLSVAALMTIGTSGVLGISFNFANVIVLPLLFGLGIAGNIHLVIRESQSVSAKSMITSSTPKAVIFSALTTVGSFGSISLSSHPGTASMGILLSIAIMSSLLCSLILLPALMGIWQNGGTPREESV